MPTTNEKLATLFLNLGRILAMEDEKKNKFRIIAYQNAARVLQNMNEDIKDLVHEDTMPKISGIGTAIQEKIISYLHNGQVPAYEEWRAKYPEEFLALFSIPHIGPKTAKVLLADFQVRNMQDLEKLVQTDKLDNHAGFGKKSVQNIREALTRVKKESKRLPLTAVFPVVYRLLAYMKQHPACESITYAGSLRRFEDTIGDVDLLTTSNQAEQLITHFVNFPESTLVQSQGDTKASIIVDENLQIDLRVVEPNSFGAALQYFTGSKDHNVHLRNIAKDQGLKLNEYGVFRGEDNIASKTEEEVYKLLGLNFIPPELRRDQGEIDEAREKPFPAFISTESLARNIPLAEENCTEIIPSIWENYPVLLNRVHEITKEGKFPLFRFSERLPISNTWQVIARNSDNVVLDFSSINEHEQWKKEIVIGFMRRSRVLAEQGFLLLAKSQKRASIGTVENKA
ncbi:MAG: hypothetical protein HY817_03370 [Candidatus Abawacabacteria bacterium]|nr:hypothetical protein [Candidatus Abawacabacteria bacterium]